MNDPDSSYPPVSPPLQEQFVDLFQQIRDAVHDVSDKAVEAAESISTTLQEIQTGLPNDVRVLALNGWFISFWHTPLQILSTLAGWIEGGEAERVDAHFSEHFDKIMNEIKSPLFENYPDRERVLSKAFAAHEQGDYELSIPVFLAQADGIAKQALNLEVYTRRGDLRQILRDRIEELITDAATGHYLLLVLEDLPLTASTRSENYAPGSLNRHGILHGIDSSYGTRLNSYRAISWLQYTDQFREAVEEADRGNQEPQC